ncbi:MAG: Hsp20/alpha crystallin family protein [Firmicutes bacterium]|nr:Hsp20/alpha crystallin family protein [Bacillota bacterium]
MALVPFDPFRATDVVRREMDRFFTPFWSDLRNEFTGPRVDVYETGQEVVALAEIPGVEKKDDIDIDIRDNMLSITGVTKRANEVKDHDRFHRSERFYGRFQRSVTLPAHVSSEGVKASYRNGVLEVRMPRKTREQQRTIDVEWH